MSAGLEGHGTQPDQNGVYGESALADGVNGLSHAEYKSGVEGINDNAGQNAGPGIFGRSRGTGVWGESATWMGVYGRTDSTTGGAGVMGQGAAGAPGVIGKSVDGAGLYAGSDHGPAAVFDGRVEVRGDIEVTGDIRLLGSGDVAELFETLAPDATSPGTVVSVGQDGRIVPSAGAYDRKVVGIVAGAGTYRPGVILDAGGREKSSPIAMVGKVYCRADASYGAIEVGDLLTTSPTEGHAMRAGDPARAFGAVVGKALGPLDEGRGLIPVVVCLQ